MVYIYFQPGELVKLQDGSERTVAFTGNGGFVYFYGGGYKNSSELKLVKRKVKTKVT